MAGYGIKEHSRDQKEKSGYDELSGAESSDQSTEENINDGGCNKPAAGGERKDSALYLQCIADGRKKQAFAGTAEAKADKDHQKAQEDIRPFLTSIEKSHRKTPESDYSAAASAMA